MKKSPIIKIRPDVEYMPPHDYEPPELKIVIAPDPNMKFCPHDQIKIYPHHRLIQCSDCGITLDPFDFLLQVGQKEGNQLSNLRYLNHQVKQLQEEETKLKASISKLKRQNK